MFRLPNQSLWNVCFENYLQNRTMFTQVTAETDEMSGIVFETRCRRYRIVKRVCDSHGILDLGRVVVVVVDVVEVRGCGWRRHDGDAGKDRLGARWALGVVLQVDRRRRPTECRRPVASVTMLLMLTALVEQQPLQEDDRQDRQSQRVDVEDLTATTSSSCRHTSSSSSRIAIGCGLLLRM